MKIILLELNEVPHKVLKKFIGTTLKGNFKSNYFKTISLDKGHLSPWITWATVHRGVTNELHKLNDINQDSIISDDICPTIFQKCLNSGLSVGLVNTMHSGRLAENKNNQFDFLIPEAFSSSPFCIPSSLERFQEFNLLMSRRSSRVVSTKIPKNINLFAILLSYFRNTKSLRAIKVVLKQLFLEIVKPYTKVRRRTIQSDLIFELFFSLLKKHNSDLSVFFTNHVASSMHRFWEATFPEDYKKQIASDDWIEKYKNEIPVAMQNAFFYIKTLKNFVDKRDNFQLWILSSMGQKSVEGYEPQIYFWDIFDMHEYVSSCLKKKVIIKVLPQMIPIYSFEAKKDVIDEYSDFINQSKNIKLRGKTSSTIAFSINNQDCILTNKGNNFHPAGIRKKVIDEKTSSAAYHIPEGFLLRYGPDLEDVDQNSFNDKGYLKTNCIKSLLEKTLNI